MLEGMAGFERKEYPGRERIRGRIDALCERLGVRESTVRETEEEPT